MRKPAQQFAIAASGMTVRWSARGNVSAVRTMSSTIQAATQAPARPAAAGSRITTASSSRVQLGAEPT